MNQVNPVQTVKTVRTVRASLDGFRIEITQDMTVLINNGKASKSGHYKWVIQDINDNIAACGETQGAALDGEVGLGTISQVWEDFKRSKMKDYIEYMTNKAT